MSDYTFLDPTDAAQELSEDDRLEIQNFCQYLDADIEDRLGASIACCDSCLAEYAKTWPRAFRNDDKFVQDGLPINVFYESARRTRSEYTRAKFDQLLQYVACPRCLLPIGTTLYPYELPFDMPLDWEQKQLALAQCASSTPFLLLRDPFARSIQDNITGICQAIEGKMLSQSLYRGRAELDMPTPMDFYPPPAVSTREGRYNHAGIPVLYLASDEATCWKECRSPAVSFHVCKVAIDKPLRVLDLVDCEDLSAELQALVYSSLMSSPATQGGWHQPQYVLTRFVADCVRAAGVDGISYPTAMGGRGTNLVILDIDNCSEWLKISEISPFTDPRAVL